MFSKTDPKPKLSSQLVRALPRFIAAAAAVPVVLETQYDNIVETIRRDIDMLPESSAVEIHDGKIHARMPANFVNYYEHDPRVSRISLQP